MKQIVLETNLEINLEKHFNVSAAQAKKFMNQIKNQLHTVDEVNPKVYSHKYVLRKL